MLSITLERSGIQASLRRKELSASSMRAIELYSCVKRLHGKLNIERGAWAMSING
jgi:hypothetical protein